MIYNLEQIKKYLPHRDPFLFVDEITAIRLTDSALSIPIKERKKIDLVGSSVEGLVSLKENHPIFAGHFPGNPILPGVIQVEMMAQVACFLFTSVRDTPVGSYEIDVALLGIDKARFKQVIRPGTPLTIKTKLIKVRDWIIIFEGMAYDGTKKCSECEFIASLKFLD